MTKLATVINLRHSPILLLSMVHKVRRFKFRTPVPYMKGARKIGFELDRGCSLKRIARPWSLRLGVCLGNYGHQSSSKARYFACQCQESSMLMWIWMVEGVAVLLGITVNTTERMEIQERIPSDCVSRLTEEERLQR